MSIKSELTTSDIIAILGILVALAWNFLQQKQISEAAYLSKASYKPFLDIVGNPSVEAFALTRHDTMNFEEQTGFINIPVRIKIQCTLKLVNRGNDSARLIARAVADTLSERALIREILLDQKAFSIDSSPEFRSLVIQPQDTLELHFAWEIQFIKGNAGVFHFLILYENDHEIMFDTYIWSRFELNDLIGVIGRPGHLKFARKDFLNLLKFRESIVDPHRYSEAEGEQIYEYMSNRLKAKEDQSSSPDEYKIEITNLRTIVHSPASDDETWVIYSKIRRTGSLIPRNTYSYVWFDTLSSLIGTFERTFPEQNHASLTLLDSVMFRTELKKGFVNRSYDHKRDVFKHVVVTYEDYLGVDYLTDLTEKLIIDKNKIIWEVVRDTTYSP